MNRTIIQGGGGISLGEPNLDGVVLLLDPADFGQSIYEYAASGGFDTVHISIGPSNAVLMELSTAVVESYALQPSGTADGGALVVLTLLPEALLLKWNDAQFGWNFSAGTGDSPVDACHDLFSSFGHATTLPGGFTGIALRTVPGLVQLARSVTNGSPGPSEFAPMLLDFELEPFESIAKAGPSRPTCAANLLINDQPLATSVHVFDATNQQWLWRVRWDVARAQSMAIVGDAGGVQIKLGLLPFGDICHELGTGQEYCAAPPVPPIAVQ